MRNSITVLTVPLVAVISASPELRAVKDCFYVPHAIVPLLYMRMELETERNDEVEQVELEDILRLASAISSAVGSRKIISSFITSSGSDSSVTSNAS